MIADIVLFRCDQCERRFGLSGGGVCSRCQRTLCGRHFPLLTWLRSPPVCRRCLAQPRVLPTLIVLFLLSALASGQETVWDSATREVERLPPSAYPELPVAIRTLAALGCTIPQPHQVFRNHSGSETPWNVIRGSFAASGQVDWAVLCSRNLTSEILVFWGGAVRCPEAPGKGPDRGLLQGVGEGRIGYSRGIAAVGRDYIMRHYEAYGGPKPPLIEHQGINNAFLDKASVVYYCYRGKWLMLQGAD